MSDNPFGPAFQAYPSPQRRGWPSWVIAVVAVFSGVLLLTASVLGVAIVAAVTDDSGSSPAIASAATPAPTSEPTPPSATTPSPKPSPTPAAQGKRLDIDFPDGTTGTFSVPSGLVHAPDDDDTGHVALRAIGDGTAYLDVYSDETTASKHGDLHLAATQAASDDRHHGNTVWPITYGKVAGFPAAEYRLTHQDDSDIYEALVTVILVGHEELALYWSDEQENFLPQSGKGADTQLLRSLDVQGDT